MGLTEDRREEFYTEFLRLPLSEDMATWNIQFKAGALMYTDKDTEDRTPYDQVRGLVGWGGWGLFCRCCAMNTYITTQDTIHALFFNNKLNEGGVGAALCVPGAAGADEL